MPSALQVIGLVYPGATSTAAAALAVLVGAISLFSNRKRPLNLLFFTISLHAALWVLARTQGGSGRFEWIRITTSLGALLPFHMWLATEAIAQKDFLFAKQLKAGLWWLLSNMLLAASTWTDFFIVPETERAYQFFGPGFYIFSTLLCAQYIILYIQAKNKSASLSGLKKIEMEILIMGSTMTAALVTFIISISAITERKIEALPFVVAGFFIFVAISINSKRILSARQLLLIFSAKAAFLIPFTGIMLGLYIWLRRNGVSEIASFSIIAASGSAITPSLFQKWKRFFRLAPDINPVKQAITFAAKTELNTESLEVAARNIIGDWLGTKNIFLYWSLRDSGKIPSIENSLINALRDAKWATPERIERSGIGPDTNAIEVFLQENDLALVVVAEGAHTLVIGAGRTKSEYPYTYPLVLQFLELAALLEAFYERAHYLERAQRAKQLEAVGMIGANIAHEIGNPLISIKTFLQLLRKAPSKELTDSFLEVTIKETCRIERLNKHLLDLARPISYTFESVELDVILYDIIELFQHDLEKHTATIKVSCEEALYVESNSFALKQVLINLIRNAIQSIENAQVRKIQVSVSQIREFVEVTVNDSGPGLDPKIRSQLFKPFQTTKAEGLGLGLAICQDILGKLGGSISVDSCNNLPGATFKILVPALNNTETGRFKKATSSDRQ